MRKISHSLICRLKLLEMQYDMYEHGSKRKIIQTQFSFILVLVAFVILNNIENECCVIFSPSHIKTSSAMSLIISPIFIVKQSRNPFIDHLFA